MLNKVNYRKYFLVLALVLGLLVFYFLQMFFKLGIYYLVLLCLLLAVGFYFSFNLLFSYIRRGISRINKALDNTAIEVLLGGSLGLCGGIVLGVLSSFPLSLIKGVGSFLTIIAFALTTYLGFKFGSRRAYDIFRLLPSNSVAALLPEEASNCKVLDTSAIIDGRIYDVCLTKFIEGRLVVPTFVIEELQHIADSADTMRRSKGRRGLDLLSKMQKHPTIKIDIIDIDISEEKEVDNKLVRLCKDMSASIVTNDYNLNKVAELQGIKVLNINELTNAVKLIVYPGERMCISVIKEGKEHGQGVGYLEDGTMVVVEDGQMDIGCDLDVVVTSVFQTAAGRMIFTRKLKDEHIAEIDHSLPSVDGVHLYG